MPASFVPMMPFSSPSPLHLFHGLRQLCLALCCALALAPSWAEKADRGLPMEIVADKSGTADLQNQISRFSGNVVITQGTMVIKADRVEIRQGADGFYMATAWGTAGAPVRYRQKRDGIDEFVEGAADKVEFDGKAEILRFIGSGVVRRLRGSQTVDEITGALITWNHATEQFSAQGGAATAANPGGRVRAVLSPRPGSEAAKAAARPAPSSSEPR
jgi:lipopolysaccharide export system protein LptA